MKVSTVSIGRPESWLSAVARSSHHSQPGPEQEHLIAAGNHGIQHGGLVRWRSSSGGFGHQFNSQVSGRLFSAALHGEIEGIIVPARKPILIALSPAQGPRGLRGRSGGRRAAGGVVGWAAGALVGCTAGAVVGCAAGAEVGCGAWVAVG